MPNYIYSTLTSDNLYATYQKQEVVNGKVVNAPIIEHLVLIKGGSNVAPAGFRRQETPIGVVTEVSDEDLERLEANEVFQTHKRNGYIIVDKKKVNPEVRAADMKTRDESAPLTDADMAKPEKKESEKVKPTGRFDDKVVKNNLK